MEEADKLILATLRNLHCDMEEDKSSLGQLTTEQVVEAVVLCIHAIDKSAQDRLSTKLPPGMSSRFNFGTKLADECRQLGCPGDLGYQTFLYASEKEVRNILIFLIEKLPQQDEILSAGPESFLTQTKRRIASRVERELKKNKENEESKTSVLECEAFCGCLKCYPTEQAPNIYDLLPRETRNSAVGALEHKKRHHSLFPSVLDSHAQLKMKVDADEQNERSKKATDSLMKIIKEEFLAAQTSLEKDNEETNIAAQSLKNKLYLAKSSEQEVTVQNKIKTDEIAGTTVESEIKKKKELVEQKQERETRVEGKTVEYKGIRSAIMNHNKTISELNLKKKGIEETLAKAKEELEKHQKILQLLPDGEENLHKLINIVQKSKDRLDGLKKQWENHKDPIEKDYLRTIESIEAMDAISKKGRKNQPSIIEKFGKIQNDIKDKELHYKKLMKITETLTEGESRDSYTNRILDILKQIEKLRDGIDAVIADVKTVQKDINMLNGKLERSYFEISITMKNKMSNKEPHIEQNMQITKRIHEECFHTVETIRKTGAVGREARDIEEHIRTEESKGLKNKIELLSRDLQALQSENKELVKQYKKVIA